MRMTMRRTAEKGEGRLGSLIFLVVLLAGGLAAWHVVPVYFDHYDYVDKVNEICRAPRHVTQRGGDATVLKMLLDEASKRRLDQWIGPESFVINTTSSGRTIQLYYEREVEILPGWTKTFHFEYTADQPII
jgi:hypothetical protein